MSDAITVLKLDHTGAEVIRYHGRVLRRDARSVTLEATWVGRETMDLGYVTLQPGDRFIEHHYTDRWYNVFAIYEGEEGTFKGWYCNITRPAHITDDQVQAVDLALDYFVQPSGREFILDEDEFAALPLSAEDVAAARAALAELQALAARHAGPFQAGTFK